MHARPPAAADSRSFRDSDGREWVVTEHPEHPEPHDAPQHFPSFLLFVTRDIVRRVRTYPANWRELSPAELEALSWWT